MEAFAYYDAGCIQIGADIETNVKSEARDDAVIHIKVVENANEIFRKVVAQSEYENNKRYLSKSETPVERRLGLW